MKEICFLRHGNADWPDWSKPDDDRPLNDDGIREMKRVAKLLQAIRFRPDVIVSSPLPRAEQTARIVAEKLGLKVNFEPRLVEDFSARELQEMLEPFKGDCALIVGHEPILAEVICELTGGRVKMAKAGAALVRLKSANRGELRWLLPPKITRALKA